jgi:hypothetical protein
MGSRATIPLAIAAVNNVDCEASTPISNTKYLLPLNLLSILNVCGSNLPLEIYFHPSRT